MGPDPAQTEVNGKTLTDSKFRSKEWKNMIKLRLAICKFLIEQNKSKAAFSLSSPVLLLPVTQDL